MRVFGIEIQVAAQSALLANATYTRPSPDVVTPDFHQVLREDDRSTSTDLAPATHRVNSGENLTRIVHQYLAGMGKRPAHAEVYAGVQAVARANGLSNPDLIYPGQVLDLSALRSHATSAVSAHPSEPLPDVALPQARSVQGVPVPRRSLHDTIPLSDPDSRIEDTAASVAPVDLLRPAAENGPEGQPVRITASAVAALKSAPIGDIAATSTARHRTGASGGDGPVPSDAAVALQRILNRTSNALHALRGLIDTPEETARSKAGPWDTLLDGTARISSEFGTRRDPFTGRMAFHDGVDLAAKRGTGITAVRGGEVTFAGWKGGYGNTVILRHPNGVETLYAHAAKLRVATGETVAAGDTIADVGSSGRSTGPHVHFEVREHGRAVNPMPYLERPATQLAENAP